MRVITAAFGAAGADVTTGARLPQLFAQAGVGTPDGTDVAGRIEPLATGRILIESVFRSLLPTALAHGITTEAEAAATLSQIDRDAHAVPRPAASVAADDRRLEAQEAGMTPGMSLLRSRAGGERRRPGPGPLDVRAIRSHFTFPEAGRIVTNNAGGGGCRRSRRARHIRGVQGTRYDVSPFGRCR